MGILISRHRVNSIEECRKLPETLGCEVDLRSEGKHIILNHDAFQTGDRLDAFLEVYGKKKHRGPLILNPKEDGLESAAIALCEKNRIENYFFLDLPIPTIVRLTKTGFRRMGIRYSEYEPLEGAATFKGLAEWIWLDCFSGHVPAEGTVKRLHELGFRVCLVSPELQGFDQAAVKKHAEAKKFLKADSDAVCTKFPELWGPA